MLVARNVQCELYLTWSFLHIFGVENTMPKLNQAQFQAVMKQLDKKAKGFPKKCPMCEINDWKVKVSDIKDFYEERLVPDAEAAFAPMLAITCGYCGYTIWFNALVLGVVDRDSRKIRK